MSDVTLRVVFAAGDAHHNAFYGNKNEVIWGSSAFLIIFALFLWKGIPAIKKASAARTQRISDEIKGAEVAKAEAEAELATLKASLGNAESDAAAIVSEAQGRVEVVKADLIARAESDVEASKQRAHIEIEASRTQAFADLQAEVAAMTVTATNAVVHDNLTDDVRNDLVEQFITQLGSTPQVTS